MGHAKLTWQTALLYQFVLTLGLSSVWMAPVGFLFWIVLISSVQMDTTYVQVTAPVLYLSWDAAPYKPAPLNCLFYVKIINAWNLLRTVQRAWALSSDCVFNKLKALAAWIIKPSVYQVLLNVQKLVRVLRIDLLKLHLIFALSLKVNYPILLLSYLIIYILIVLRMANTSVQLLKNVKIYLVPNGLPVLDYRLSSHNLSVGMANVYPKNLCASMSQLDVQLTSLTSVHI